MLGNVDVTDASEQPVLSICKDLAVTLVGLLDP